ncbi:DUF1934 domain-containing protein [Paenibacillus sanguinis]|uniref:DUF1934 domain-containing protein n=1 Tax=Paenibacillus sanguinis TaxID=225906 RepID=UPI000364416E|nr:DUF1934 domain-containing protein [Paenibacillus sanguinis]
MSETIPVNLLLTSRQGGDETVQRLRGNALLRGESVYIRYDEPEPGPEGTQTRTMLKITGEELKIMRHGGVESEQTFRSGQRLPGFYHSALTRFQLSTDTLKLDAQLIGVTGFVNWEYDLYVYEECSDRFIISLHIQEDV